MQGEDVAVLSDHDGDANVNVRQQAQVLVVDHAGGLAHISGDSQLHRGRHSGYAASPGASGECVPNDFYFLSGLQTAYIRLVDKCANQNAGEVGFLQH